MEESVRQFVRGRASDCCEYCRLAQGSHVERFSVDHVIARKHGGSDEVTNLAFSCLRCNLHKGTDLTARDPQDGAIVRLFDPRSDLWHEHFVSLHSRIEGITSIGRATVRLLQMNAPERVRLREALEDAS